MRPGPVLGGLPRYGVPNFRLAQILLLIVEVGANPGAWRKGPGQCTRVGEDISLAEIRARHDAAVIIATGLIIETPRPSRARMPQSGLANFCMIPAMGFNHHQIGETVS